MFSSHKTFVGWLLAVVMMFSPTLVYAQAPAATEAATTESNLKLDVSYVVPDAVFGAVIYPSRILNAPVVRMNPMLGMMTGELKKNLGFDATEIEQLLVVVDMPRPGKAPGAGMVLRLSQPRDIKTVLPSLRERTSEATIEGKPYLRANNAANASLYMPDDRTLLVADDAMLQKMVANRSHPVKGTLSAVLGRYDGTNDALAILLIKSLRPMLNAEITKKGLPPPELAELTKLPNLIDTFGLKASLSGQGSMTLSARCPDEASAVELEKIINDLLTMAKQKMSERMAAMPAGANPQQAAMAQQMAQASQKMIDMFRPVRKGNRIEVAQEGQGGVAAAGMVTALLLPAVQAAREAARRTKSINNMRQIGIMMHNYHDAYRAFPARAIFDKESKPLLSWRVQVLQYLDQDLYQQFHLDEPWDSAHNKTLIEKMPEVFRNPSSGAAPGMTTYLAPVGPGTLFEGDKGRTMRDIRDGTSHTVMFVEANDDQAVIWTKPDDWQFDPEKPLAGLGSAHPNLFQVGFCDGSVLAITAGIDPQVWKALLTINGREAVDPASYSGNTQIRVQ
ncbi:MAG TPA: DUF1559 domain-containing protein [Thermoguttaceae bacterium]|nr:DUF1559 domain-containing protein [Thermoguttaceae bacterium]